MADTLQTLAARQNGYPLLFNAWTARLAKLVKDYVDATAGTPSHSIKFAGSVTSTNAATNTFTVTGAATTDVVMAVVKVAGAATPRLLSARISATNTLELKWDTATPGTDNQVSYTVIRAV
jgi:hypothetical protein